MKTLTLAFAFTCTAGSLAVAQNQWNTAASCSFKSPGADYNGIQHYQDFNTGAGSSVAHTYVDQYCTLRARSSAAKGAVRASSTARVVRTAHTPDRPREGRATALAGSVMYLTPGGASPDAQYIDLEVLMGLHGTYSYQNNNGGAVPLVDISWVASLGTWQSQSEFMGGFDGGEYWGYPLEPITVTVRLPVGQRTKMILRCEVYAELDPYENGGGTNGGSVQGTMDLGSTVKWEGIVSATDSLGNDITETLTLIDDEDVDWTGPVGCSRADFDGDADVDTADFIAYLNEWAQQRGQGCEGDLGCTADLTNDQLVDTRDFLAFLAMWANGC